MKLTRRQESGTKRFFVASFMIMAVLTWVG
jgi:hypothetical protein